MVADYHVARKEVRDKPKIEVADHGFVITTKRLLINSESRVTAEP